MDANIVFALISAYSRLTLVRVGWDNMKNSAAKRNKDLRKIKTRGRCRPRVFCMRMPVLGSRAERKCAGAKPDGVSWSGFVDKFTREVLQYHEAGVKLS
jgi:hypothetical protein